MFKKFIFIHLLLFIFFTDNIFAWSIADEQERIQKEQQRLIEEEFRQKELERATKRPQSSAEDVQELPQLIPSGSCIEIKKIKFSGNTAISDKKIIAILEKYENRCLTIAEINQMLQDITNLYITQGYITSRAFMTMPQPRLKEKILEIKIIEGKLSQFDGIEPGMIMTAFPNLAGNILNLRDIEQGLDQINRLPSNRATMEIKPLPEQDAASKVTINNTPAGSTRLTFFSDNSGSKNTGEWRAGMRFAQDNMLGLNEQINLSYTNSPHSNYDHKNANSITCGLSMPYGYWTLNNNFSYSDYRTSFILPISGERMYSFGDSYNNSISLERIISRGQQHKFSIAGGINYKKSKNYTKIMDLQLKNEASSRSLSTIFLEFPITAYYPGGVLYVKPGIVQGTKLFGALDDSRTHFSQKAQYSALKLYGYSSKAFKYFYLVNVLDAQFSDDELFGSEAFYIGGEYSVRGFKEYGVQGDKGLALRNDLTFNLNSIFNSSNEFLSALTPGLFFDYGSVSPNRRGEKSSDLAGAGAKLGLNYKFLESSVSYAWVLKKREWLKEHYACYFYAGINLKF